ncbi:hypothetical protein BD309DRAFT_970375 [Dichomitus squalens]|uniref:Uncharacterized protein n=1 Tax=Dichomitus squalens TaxID=114155 RepID=A0A4Q9PSK3_9APHY|nr:hypothetical protein BD309DRAFT_970375 [Dichomitus squalens]TBU57389.1 hypothetical protein BD310DRAFT_929609 [Dichomitus squalens]
MPAAEGLRRLQSFSRAPPPNDDISIVKTNLTQDSVRLLQNILAYHVASHPGSRVFGNEQGKGLKLVEASIRNRNGVLSGDESLDDLEATTVCELVVDQSMLNVHGTFAGACAAHIIDIATFSPLFALATVTGSDPSGFSTSMNLVWHAPAVLGSTLRFVGTSLSCKAKFATARCEVYDKEKGTLIVSATHVVAPVRGLAMRGAPTQVHKSRARL